MSNESSEHSSPEVDRRSFLVKTAAGVGAGLLAAAPLAQAQEKRTALKVQATAFAQVHQIKPLPFDSGSLDGLSKNLIDSHWSHNYAGSVRALNETKKRLADALSDSSLPAYIYNDLKREHLMRTGSVVLHELYFENLGANGRPGSATESSIGSAFGGFDRWETEFRRIAAGLGGGSGWTILGYNRQFGTLENYWMADHMHSPALTVPLLVMDLYEHSYQMDYGAATAKYIDAFFKNINWERVAARIEALQT